MEEESARPEAPDAADSADKEWEERLREHAVFNPAGMAAKAAKKQLDEKVAAARGFLDSLRFPRPPRD